MAKIIFLNQGFIFKSGKANLVFDDFEINEEVDAIFATKQEYFLFPKIPKKFRKKIIKDCKIFSLPFGFKIIEQNTIAYLTKKPNKKFFKEIKNCDILICSDFIFNKNEIKNLKPKLVVLRGKSIYAARELQKLTGIQTIVAKPGFKIDTRDYIINLQKKLI